MILDSTGFHSRQIHFLILYFPCYKMTVDNDQGLGACHHIFLREVSGNGKSDLWISIYSFKHVLSCVLAVGEINSVVFLELLIPQKFRPRI